MRHGLLLALVGLTLVRAADDLPADPTKSAPPAAPAAAPSDALALKSRQSKLHGLLVMEIGEGKLAGQASLMNATAVQNPDRTAPAAFKFNQEVGDDMAGALNEVRKFLDVRHDGWPAGWTVEVSFEDRHRPKDGPSAAVACALLMESLITGEALDEKTAVTGDMNADGSVQPVGGVPDKAMAAADKGCAAVCIPVKNLASITDYAVLNGPKPIARIQIFAVEKFDEARAVASAKRDEKLAAAMTGFLDVQRAVANARDPATVIKHPKVVARLQEIVAAAPQHASARLLLAMATGKLPRTLSTVGSLEAIEREAQSLLAGVHAGKPAGSLERDQLGSSLSRLAALRTRLDKRTLPYFDAINDYGSTMRRYLVQDEPTVRAEAERAVNEIRTRAAKVQQEWDRLRADKDLMKQLIGG